MTYTEASLILLAVAILGVVLDRVAERYMR